MFKPGISNEEFNTSMLPHNRREVFFDVVKYHWVKFLLLGVIVFLFALPTNLAAILTDLYRAGLSAEGRQDGVTDERLAQIVASISALSNYSALADILFLMIFAVGFAGISRVIRQFAWEENVDLRYDFSTGIKQNVKGMLLLFFAGGLLKFFCVYIQNLSSVVTSGGIYDYLGIIPTVLFSVFLLPAAGYAAVSMTVYSNSFTGNIKLGFAVYFKLIWQTLLAALLCSLILVPQMIPNIYCHIAGRTAACFLIPFVMLGWYLFAFNSFDRVVNRKQHPELVNKGIVPLKEGEKSYKQIKKERKRKEKNDRKKPE